MKSNLILRFECSEIALKLRVHLMTNHDNPSIKKQSNGYFYTRCAYFNGRL